MPPGTPGAGQAALARERSWRYDEEAVSRASCVYCAWLGLGLGLG